VDLTVAPELLYIVGGPRCDLRQEPCPESLVIVGSGFANTANLSCHVAPVTVSLPLILWLCYSGRPQMTGFRFFSFLNVF
jgi:hypothetical protein